MVRFNPQWHDAFEGPGKSMHRVEATLSTYVVLDGNATEQDVLEAFKEEVFNWSISDDLDEYEAPIERHPAHMAYVDDDVKIEPVTLDAFTKIFDDEWAPW